MNSFSLKLRKAEFEFRIFISFTLTGVICLLGFVVFRDSPDNLTTVGRLAGWTGNTLMRPGFFLIALLMLLASILRMWAGSHLSSARIMAFKVQTDVLTTSGPFHLVRNPVYLADLIAFTGFALCLPWIGLLLPVLILLHYNQLIIYEEESLARKFGKQFKDYKDSTPRLFPSLNLVCRNRTQTGEFRITYDGFRNNALYLLFIPGFVLAGLTGSFLYVLAGLPAVLDWAIIHTVKGVAKKPGNLRTKEKMLARSKVFGDVLYAQCWEDPQIDIEAFDIQPDDVVFTITSGGCNALAFLACNPRKVIALDLNPCQNYLLDLKIAAFKCLSRNELLEFIGVTPSDKRLSYYHTLRHCLRNESLEYWDLNSDKIIGGLVHCGRYEKYMRLLKKMFELVMGKSLILDLKAAGSLIDRVTVFERKWNTLKWRFFTRVLLSRPFMSLFFDKAFFAQIEDSFSFGKHFQRIIRSGLTRFPIMENHFLSYILLGNYDPAYLPLYLREENFETIRKRLDRVEIVTGDCLSYFKMLPDNSISKFNFTNIFEWMPVEQFEQILRESLRISFGNPVLTYRNLLVPRSRPEVLSGDITPDDPLATYLYQRDRSFIYRRYIVERIYNHNGIQGS